MTAENLSHTLQNIQIGREVKLVGDDALAVGAQTERGGREFEQIHRNRVADDDLSLRRADETRDLLADADGRVPPAFVPAADQVAAPLVFDDGAGAFRRSLGETAKRIPVHVEQVGVSDDELLAEGGEFVLRVKLEGKGTGGGEGLHHYSF